MEGHLKLRVEKVSTLQSMVSSAPHMIANIPLRLSVATDGTGNKKYLSVYLFCDYDNKLPVWSFDVSCDFVLVSQTNHVSDLIRSSPNNTYSCSRRGWGFKKLVFFSDVINSLTGYIHNDSITLEANVKITNRRGMRKFPIIDFTVPQPNSSDVVLNVGGARLHVNKTFLGMHSPMFYSMFFSKFAESKQEEVELKEVVGDEFMELLGVLYPSHKPVTARNVEYLLKLGDKFDVAVVMEKCEKFLLKSEDIAIAKKLLFADLYALSELQDECLKDLKTPSQIKALKRTEEYERYGTNICKAILNKTLESV